MDILHKPQINMFYIFKMKKNILYIFYGLCILYFVVLSIHKVKKTERCNVCTHCINHICVAINISSPSLQNKDPGGGVGSTSRGWRWVGLGVEMGGFRDQRVEMGRFRYM